VCERARERERERERETVGGDLDILILLERVCRYQFADKFHTISIISTHEFIQWINAYREVMLTPTLEVPFEFHVKITHLIES
jgi:hypothetical protein